MDHDLVVDKNFNIYVVFGSKHPYGFVYAYLKYRSLLDSGGTSKHSIWSFRGVPLARVMERYSVGNVLDVMGFQSRIYDPVYDSVLPYLRYSEIYMHLLPEVRIREILERPRDDLELVVSEAVYMLRNASGVSLDYIGVGGSVLGGFHNVDLSDIDLVVYGCDNAVRVYHSIEGFAEPLKGSVLERWVRNQAELHGVSMDLARRMYAPYRRSLFRGRALTVVFPEPYSRYGDLYFRSYSSCCIARVEVPPNQCGALHYPGLVRVSGRVIPSGGCRFSGVDVDWLVLYEGAFSPIVFEGGPLEVRGVLARVYPGGGFAIIVGSRECGGNVFTFR